MTVFWLRLYGIFWKVIGAVGGYVFGYGIGFLRFTVDYSALGYLHLQNLIIVCNWSSIICGTP